MKLHQLPTGTWIDLSAVTRIEANPKSIGKSYPEDDPRVVICCSFSFDVIHTSTAEEAEALRDSLAALVNSAAQQT